MFQLVRYKLQAIVSNKSCWYPKSGNVVTSKNWHRVDALISTKASISAHLVKYALRMLAFFETLTVSSPKAPTMSKAQKENGQGVTVDCSEDADE